MWQWESNGAAAAKRPQPQSRDTSTAAQSHDAVPVNSSTSAWMGGNANEGPLGQVVRILRESGKIKDREAKRDELVKLCEEMERSMDEVVSKELQNFNSSMEAYTITGAKIRESRQRIALSRQHLLACKELLQVRQMSLKTMWHEHVETKEMIRLLKIVSDVRRAPDRIENLFNAKKYLSATRLLLSCQRTLDGDVADVGALNELRSTLMRTRSKLTTLMNDDLCALAYLHMDAKPPLSAEVVERDEAATAPSLRTHADLSSVVDHDEDDQLFPIELRRSHSNSNENVTNSNQKHLESSRQIWRIVRALHELKALPEAVRIVRLRLKVELSSIISAAVTLVGDTASTDSAGTHMLAIKRHDGANLNQPLLLVQLLHIVFDAYLSLARRHTDMLGAISNLQTKNTKVPLNDGYTVLQCWTSIESEIRTLLQNYLYSGDGDLAPMSSSAFARRSSDALTSADLLFGPATCKKDKKSKRQLFSFANSRFAIAANAFMEEQQSQQQQQHSSASGNPAMSTSLQSGKPVEANDRYSARVTIRLLCNPDSRNVTLVYDPAMRFVKSMQKICHLTPAQTSSLVDFLESFLLTSLLPSVLDEISRRWKNLEGPDAFKIPVRETEEHPHGTQPGAPLLYSATSVNGMVKYLFVVLVELPSLVSSVVPLMFGLLERYRNLCREKYQDLVHYTEMSTHKNLTILSASWARETIYVAFGKQRASWTRAVVGVLQERSSDSLSRASGVSKGEIDASQEVEKDRAAKVKIRKLDEQEYGLQAKLFADIMPTKYQVLLDLGKVRLLANLHQSCEWLAQEIQSHGHSLLQDSIQLWSELTADASQMTGSFSAVELLPHPETIRKAIHEKDLQQLSEIAQDFVELSDTSLLTLRMELRVQCFYYLLPAIRRSNYASDLETIDADSNVTQFNSYLMTFDETLASSLSFPKRLFVFDGLDYLAATILIDNVHCIRRLNKTGVRKMLHNIAALEQTIRNIAPAYQRTSEFEKARLFYETMLRDREDIITDIMKGRPPFSQRTYVKLFSAQQQFAGGNPDEHAQYIVRLAKAFHHHEESGENESGV